MYQEDYGLKSYVKTEIVEKIKAEDDGPDLDISDHNDIESIQLSSQGEDLNSEFHYCKTDIKNSQESKIKSEYDYLNSQNSDVTNSPNSYPDSDQDIKLIMNEMNVKKYRPGSNEIDYEAMVDDIFEDKYIFKISANKQECTSDLSEESKRNKQPFHAKLYSIKTRKKFNRQGILQEWRNLAPYFGRKLKQNTDNIKSREGC